MDHGKRTVRMSLKIGAHTSAAGGLFHALLEAREIGATITQYFTANQRQWRAKELTKETAEQWHQAREDTGIDLTVSHASYLINLCSDKEEVIAKSIDALGREIKRCAELKTALLNFHPGSSKERSREEALDLIIEGVRAQKPLLEGSGVKILFETTAGQGSQLGFALEDHAYLLSRLKGELEVGVCVDTCHSFAAGYALHEDWRGFVDQFDAIVGLEYLSLLHLNDSLKGLGSRVDRHAPLGEGQIGISAFEQVVLDPRTRSVPLILETPGGTKNWTKEITYLRKIAKEGALTAP